MMETKETNMREGIKSVLPFLHWFGKYCKGSCQTCPPYKIDSKKGFEACPLIYKIDESFRDVNSFLRVRLDPLAMKYTGDFNPIENMKEVKALESEIKRILWHKKHVEEIPQTEEPDFDISKLTPEMKKLFEDSFPIQVVCQQYP